MRPCVIMWVVQYVFAIAADSVTLTWHPLEVLKPRIYLLVRMTDMI